MARKPAKDKQVPAHGGARKGAGRKPKGSARGVNAGIVLAPEDVARLAAVAKSRGLSRSALGGQWILERLAKED